MAEKHLVASAEQMEETHIAAEAKGKAQAAGKLRRFARKKGHHVPEAWIQQKFEDYKVTDPNVWGFAGSAQVATDDLIADFTEEFHPTVDARSQTSRGGGKAPTGLGYSYYVAEQVRPYAEAFRKEAWGRDGAAYTNADEAAPWIERQHRKELALMGEPKERVFLDVWLTDRIYRWAAHPNGLLGKLQRLCARVHQRFGCWTEREALAFVLLGVVPLIEPRWSRRGEVAGFTLTLTLPAPATEEEVLSSYREALDALKASPKALSFAQGRLLALVYELPLDRHTWTERLARWLEWRSEGNNAEAMSDYGAVKGSKDAYRNLDKAYHRALERSTWRGNVDRERPGLGLYTSPFGPAAKLPRRNFQTPEPLPPLSWEKRPKSRPKTKPAAKYKEPPVNLDRFTRLEAGERLGITRAEAKAIVHFFQTEPHTNEDWLKVVHVMERIQAIARGDILRPADK